MAQITASIKTVEQGPAAVKFFISVCKSYDDPCSEASGEYTIGNLASVRFNFVGVDFKMTIKVSTMKHKLAEDSAVKVWVTWHDTSLSVPKSWFCTDDWVEKYLGGKQSDLYTYEATHIATYRFEVTIIANKMTLMGAPFYNDKNFTDTQLTATDGSVGVHKLALASHSDMFKTMLGGEWKETVEGRIELEGATLQTLQHLKDYMYLGALPGDGLRPLLLLAKRYLIEYLERDCILELAQTVKPEDLLDLLDFARENGIPKLTLAVIQHTSDTTVNSVYKMLEEIQIGKTEDKE